MHLHQQDLSNSFGLNSALIEKEIPEQSKNLADNVVNLEKVAQYCEDIYVNSKDANKNHLLNETKGYTTQALASVAYQIHVLANSFLQLLENQSLILNDMSLSISNLSHEVNIHKEKVARREIGVLTTNKCVMRTLKVKRPDIDEKPVKYIRKPIDYSSMDDIGHGVKLNNQFSKLSTGSVVINRQNSYSSTHSSSSVSLTTTNNNNNNNNNNVDLKNPTPPLILKSNNSNGMGTVRSTNGTISSAASQAGSSYYHRAPVQPPSVPSEYLSRQELGIYSSKKDSAIYSTGNSMNSIGYGGPNNNRRQLSALQSEYSDATNIITDNNRNMMLNNNNNSNKQLLLLQQQQQQQQQHGNDFSSSSVGYASGSDAVGIIRTNLNNIDYATNGTMYRRPQLNPAVMVYQEQQNRASSLLNHPLPPQQQHQQQQQQPQTTIVLDDDDDIIPNWVPLDKCLEKVITTYDYEGMRDDELSFKENMYIYVIKKNDDLWYEGIMKNENGDVFQGLFPYNYAVSVRKYAVDADARVTQC